MSDGQTYGDVRNRVRDGDNKVKRNHLLSSEQKRKIREQSDAMGQVVPNPFARVGLYQSQVQALIDLGIDQWHSFNTVYEKVQEIMMNTQTSSNETAWEKAINRKSNSPHGNSTSIKGKVETNFRVLQRIPNAEGSERNPYGAKLAQFGLAVDIKYEALEGFEEDEDVRRPMYRLNSQWDEWDPESGPCQVIPYLQKRRKTSVNNEENKPSEVETSDSTGQENLENQSDQSDQSEGDNNPFQSIDEASTETEQSQESVVSDYGSVENSSSDDEFFEDSSTEDNYPSLDDEEDNSGIVAGAHGFEDPSDDPGKQFPPDAIHSDFDE